MLSRQQETDLFRLDRTDGKLIAAHPFVNQNWAKYIDLKTGRPVLTDVLDRAIKGETVDLSPRLATNASLSAYNAKTGLLYLNSWELVRVMKFIDQKVEIGQGYTGIETAPSSPTPDGYHIAMNHSRARSRGRPRFRISPPRRARSALTAVCLHRQAHR